MERPPREFSPPSSPVAMDAESTLLAVGAFSLEPASSSWSSSSSAELKRQGKLFFFNKEFGFG